jgi:ankyrin repeat protein
MRLLHTKYFKLQEFGGREVPNYAILSHTWGKEEVTLQDITTNKARKLLGYAKVSKACLVAAADGFDYVWIDTCCIDKTSSAELSEALNSMYRWYQEAGECYAYLADVVKRGTGVVTPEFRESRWFTRGWTLQELIAPLSVIFLDKEWQEIGTKLSLQRDISKITGIPGSFLLGDDLRHASVAQKMSWASKRETTRTEDLAYCLMGLFGIYMPMLYGEGEKAFIRLQEEIMRVSDDHSIFAWRSAEDHGGILASSPAAFTDSGNIISVNATSSPSTLSSRGIHLSLPFINNDQQSQEGLAILHCTEIEKEGMRFALHLRDIFQTKEDYVREQSTTLQLIDLKHISLSQHPPTSLYIRQWHSTRNRKLEDIEECVVKLAGVDVQEVTSRIANFDSNCELSNGLMIMNIAAIPNGILGRLLIVCKDGFFFQIVLKKYGSSLSVDISTSIESDLQNIQDLNIPGREQNDQYRIVKLLGNGKQRVDITIKKRVRLLRGRRSLTGVVEISCSSKLKGAWLEQIAILEKACNKRLLSYAALRGLITVVEHLLDQDSIGSNTRDGLRTPLSWAAEGGQEAVIKYLLEKGAALELKDMNGRTPLSWAAGAGHEAMVKLLLGKGADFESKDSDGRTPLSWAAGNGHEDVVKLLLGRDADLDSNDSGGWTPLSSAAWQWLLPANGSKVETKRNDSLVRHRWLELEDSGGRTLLSWAAGKGHEAVVKLLLDNGADLETKDTTYGQTPLWWATEMGYEPVVKLLLDKGAELETKDTTYGQTPLWWAAERGHSAVVKLLLDKGAELETKDTRYGQTPLWWATQRGHEAVVKLLLDKGAELGDKVFRRPQKGISMPPT